MDERCLVVVHHHEDPVCRGDRQRDKEKQYRERKRKNEKRDRQEE